MTPTTVLVRQAIKNISEWTCGTRPKVIPVRAIVSPSAGDQRCVRFEVTVPFEYELEVYAFLRQRLQIAPPAAGLPLLLSGEQACALIEAAIQEASAKEAV